MAAHDDLLQAMADMPVIDAHEHVPEESDRTDNPVDAFTLFSHYTETDLKSAGMSPAAYERMQSPKTPLDEKWELVAPYWERIRYGSYSRPILIAIRELYGFEDLNRDTYRPLSEIMQQHNTPGIYHHVFRDLCHIEKVLTQIGRIPTTDRDLLIPLLPVSLYFEIHSAEDLRSRTEAFGMSLGSLDDYLAAVRRGMEAWKADGAVGVKMSAYELPCPSPEDAAAAFSRIMTGQAPDAARVLSHFVHHQMLDIAGELNLVVAVHCGIIWDNWNNPYTVHPSNMVPVLLAHRNTRFDLYHAAIPWYGDLGVLGKDFPNAYLNMCWCHVISQQMSQAALDQWLDLVPVNKLIGFGGDYRKPVEKVYGHLQMAKEDIAAVLSRRVDAALLTATDAIRIARMLLHDNAAELYAL